MREIFWVLCAVVVFVSLHSNAQTSTSVGLKAGMNIATASDANSSAIIGFVGGGFLVHRFSNLFAVQSEFLFTIKQMLI